MDPCYVVTDVERAGARRILCDTLWINDRVTDHCLIEPTMSSVYAAPTANPRSMRAIH